MEPSAKWLYRELSTQWLWFSAFLHCSYYCIMKSVSVVFHKGWICICQKTYSKLLEIHSRNQMAKEQNSLLSPWCCTSCGCVMCVNVGWAYRESGVLQSVPFPQGRQNYFYHPMHNPYYSIKLCYSLVMTILLFSSHLPLCLINCWGNEKKGHFSRDDPI